MQPQLGHTGLPSVSGQRSRRNTFSTPRSHIRMIFAALSVRAAAESKKCCATAIVPTKMSNTLLTRKHPRYKANFSGGACYMMPDMSLLAAHGLKPGQQQLPAIRTVLEDPGLLS